MDRTIIVGKDREGWTVKIDVWQEVSGQNKDDSKGKNEQQEVKTEREQKVIAYREEQRQDRKQGQRNNKKDGRKDGRQRKVCHYVGVQQEKRQA